MIISSKANPAIKKIASLTEKKYRKMYGEYLVEGVKSVNDCIAAQKQITQLVCTEEYAEKYGGALIVTDELFTRISTEKTPQGVMTSVKCDELRIRPPEGCCLLLDRVQDPGNLGTIIRTANAAGYTDLYLVNCADAFSPKTIRASMGGIFRVNIFDCGYEEAFAALKGVPLVTADMSGEDAFAFAAPERFCLCIGNEGNGVGNEVEARTDFTVKIPMRDTCESLNAAVSAGILMYVLKNNQK